MSRRLRPLWTPGIPGGGASLGIPRRYIGPATGLGPSSYGYFDDFVDSNLGTTPATGLFNWERNDVVGTGSLIRAVLSPTGTAPTVGAAALSPAAVDTNITGMALGGLATHTPFLIGASNSKQYVATRFGLTLAATSITGFGFLPSTIALTADWITDPDTTLAAVDALIIHRNTAAYAGTTTNGSWTARLYENTAADQHVQIRSSGTSGLFYKFEIYWDGLTFHFGDGGAEVATITPDAGGTFAGTTGVPGGVRYQVANNGTASARVLNIDYLMYEGQYGSSIVR